MIQDSNRICCFGPESLSLDTYWEPIYRLGITPAPSLCPCLRLPRMTTSPYTFADGTWDVDGFLRYLQHKGWITNVASGLRQVSQGCMRIRHSAGGGGLADNSSEAMTSVWYFRPTTRMLFVLGRDLC